MIEFLNQSDIMYTSLGHKDHVYLKFNGKRKYKQWQYLLWPLCEILSITNSNAGNEQSSEPMFGRELTTLSQLCAFLKLHEEYTFNSNIPHTCLFEICGNFSFCRRVEQSK